MKTPTTLSYSAFFILFLILITNIHPQDKDDTWGWNRWAEDKYIEYPDLKKVEKETIEKESSLLKKALLSALHWYKHNMSKDSCPCYPSCSNFSYYSIKEYGSFLGLVMTFDRLYYRENIDLFTRKKKIKYEDRMLYYDTPRQNNIFLEEEDIYLFPHNADNQPFF